MESTMAEDVKKTRMDLEQAYIQPQGIEANGNRLEEAAKNGGRNRPSSQGVKKSFISPLRLSVSS